VTATDDFPELVSATGCLPTTGRGSMPFALLHGEALVAVAAWAAGEAGVELLDFDAAWSQVQAADRPLVLHDPLCPMTPVPFISETVRRAVDDDAVVVAVHPVTDTVKSVEVGPEGPVVGATVDRDSLWAVTSPVVLPASVVAALEDWPDVDDFGALVSTLRDRFAVTFVEAPLLARRVEDESAVRLLEAYADEHG
jgi:2-C-methyl-D-erythritol 4-phosphate cytidylyltransferase